MQSRKTKDVENNCHSDEWVSSNVARVRGEHPWLIWVQPTPSTHAKYARFTACICYRINWLAKEYKAKVENRATWLAKMVVSRCCKCMRTSKGSVSRLRESCMSGKLEAGEVFAQNWNSFLNLCNHWASESLKSVPQQWSSGIYNALIPTEVHTHCCIIISLEI